MEHLLTIMPGMFMAVERELWNSKLNFFLLIKAIVLKPAPGSKIKDRMLQIFGSLLINCLPSVEDEPKVAVTEILHILLPVYLASHNKNGPFNKKSAVVKTITQLLHNLTLNLRQSDEIEASSIAVFNLVCKVFDLRDDFECLQPMSFKLDLDTYCPFNFHKIEAVRYSYNLLISKCLSQKEHNLQVKDLQSLHTLVVQSLAMETSPRLVKLLTRVL